jgi:hypothetical protein
VGSGGHAKGILAAGHEVWRLGRGGAERRGVIAMVMRGAVVQILIGLAIGIPVALLCVRFVKMPGSCTGSAKEKRGPSTPPGDSLREPPDYAQDDKPAKTFSGGAVVPRICFTRS